MSSGGYSAPSYGGGAPAAAPSFGGGVPNGLPNANASGLMHVPLPVAATKFGIDKERKFTGRERRRKTLFDVPPGGVAAIVGHDATAAVVAAATDKAGAAGAANLQASRHARRIYVGGIGNVQEQDIEDFFNSVMAKAYKPVDGGAVLSVYINSVRRFAFVEFRTIEMTTAAMQLDGISYNGQPLKLRRPNDYNPDIVPTSEGGNLQLDLNSLGMVSTSVPDGPNKIFIGGIPHHLKAEEVMQLLTPFGALKAFHLVGNGGEASNGYAFCEFEDPAVTDVVCAGLNNLALLDRTLTVRKADGAAGGGGAGGPGGANAMPLGQGAPASTTTGAAAPPPSGESVQPRNAPTSVLRLSNMVTAAELADDAEYADIKADIAQEAGKFATVQSVTMPRFGAPGTGMVFIKFSDAAGASVAAGNLAGRTFGERTVCAEFITEDDLQAGRLG